MLRRLVVVIAALGMLFYAVSQSRAEWSLEDMNNTIEQTNFVVNGGCSGTLISLKERLVLTNYHCIAGNVEAVEREVTDDEGFVHKVKARRYTDVTLEQNSYDGFARVGSSSYVAEIAAEDKKRDMALLRIKGPITQTVASVMLPDDGKMVRGERAYAVGNPARQYATLVEGVISNLNRTFEFEWTGGEKLPMIQFSGGLYGGNSGGALYNAKGQLIGVPAAGFPAATFIGLAIPVSIVKKFMRDSCFASVFDASADDVKCHEVKTEKAEKAKKAHKDAE